ncbi:type I DNA topoisomerase [Yersinia enterocolitica]|uniref:DNA topoisomerase 1 n=1 Tax=Yersinia enterocolitica subsp. palearctica serotype O:3 (strain DSM 13030 / CIP 106945 / Y11) TaxID=930944 RepID=A0A0H3NZC1_YERE1|nr:type I DNA topoisomerase [Yersinia enterocolitica]EHB19308.1 DNA topoisomerase I subunit omega [Yersinia enterocolitica subsp. palearctica PhRBD_Ye1]EKN3313609.1 type I DNA topoisomerase [Yersinia enterocolitica]EKN3317628.1 type I DNA topoisomerase [Yersinia enterocolitica]EKN3321342.1 type I DNA topoisomerase [Yersinia enterocolitica]EKN3333479.1 type I DNA topoisomerase [Yersinia enterocolitica]
MGKALVIVESPAKAKTINKYLGNNYVVKSSVGHIRDLPTSGSASKKSANSTEDKAKKADKPKTKVKKDEKVALVNRMGVDPYHGWKAQYEILPGKEKVVAELKALAENADHIYLATDLDREGEAIAWHLREVIGGDDKRFSRVVFNEITKNAIQQAFNQPGELNINRVNAQQARRFMDRVVGYMVSPLLWKKIARGLSAGRVQSVAVRLVVERERDIKAFVPEEYWELHADLLAKGEVPIQMEVTHAHNKPFKPVNREQTHAALKLLENARYKVLDREDKPTSSKPGAPFITSTLQQAASTRLSFGVKKTMMMAQRLYEAGHITYMRTDSTNLSQDALTMVRGYIGDNFGDKYLPSAPNQYSSKENSQEAHEAIRPSDVNVLAEQLKDMEADAQKLYQLIWRQFVACQMTPAKYDSTTLTVQAGDFQLRAKGRTLRFDGWTKVMPALRKGDEDRTLPVIEVGSELDLQKLIPSQHFTKPPARYSEASLVKELEKRGIGRPSTYASIISTIQDRGYVRVENRRFYAEKMGEIVTDRLEENFRELMNYDFTARMESGLDQVANDQAEWKAVLDGFFAEFSEQLEKAEKDPEEGGMRPNQMVMTSIDCPTCGRQMGIRTASTGVFLGCSGYALPPKERCKTTINLVPEAEILNILEGDDAETNALRAKRRCQKCGTAMDSYLIDNQRKLHVCGNNPECDGYEIEEGEFRIKGYEGPIVECEKCGSEMHLKMGRFGKYMGCTNDECKNTRKILRSGEVAPPKEDPVPLPELPCEKSDAYFVLRDGAAGVFLAANTFPKSRETRAPLVEELVRFKDRLPEKLRYLADAPVADNEGNKTLVRFSRKTKQQYVSSEKEGKATGWSAFYIDGKWVEAKK